MAGRIARGEVRLHRFAAPDKERPVLVLTRDSVLPHLASVTVAPITSNIRGIASQVILDENDGMRFACAVNLHNTVTIPQNKLGKRVAQLSETRMSEVCAAIRYSFGCE